MGSIKSCHPHHPCDSFRGLNTKTESDDGDTASPRRWSLTQLTTAMMHWDFKALVYEIRGSRDVECKNYGSVGYTAGRWVPYQACLSRYRARVPSYTRIVSSTLESSLSNSHVFIHHVVTYGSNTAQRMGGRRKRFLLTFRHHASYI